MGQTALATKRNLDRVLMLESVIHSADGQCPVSQGFSKVILVISATVHIHARTHDHSTRLICRVGVVVLILHALDAATVAGDITLPRYADKMRRMKRV